jgi:transposase
MRKRYSKAYIEKIDIAEMKKQPGVTEEAKKATRVNRDVAAPGRLLQIIRETMKYDEVNAAYSSKECHCCNKITGLTDEQNYTCEHCGTTWNRHFNAARVLFGRGESRKGKTKKRAGKRNN